MLRSGNTITFIGLGAYITRGIAADRIVTTAMDANVSSTWSTLHSHLEVPDIVRRQNIPYNRRSVSKALVDGISEVAFEATGVMGRSISIRENGCIGQRMRHWSKGQSHYTN